MALPGPLPPAAELAAPTWTDERAATRDADPDRGGRLLTREFGLVITGSAGAWLTHSMAQWAVAPFLVALGFDPVLGGIALGVIATGALGSRLIVGPRIDRHGGRPYAVAGGLLLTLACGAYAAGSVLPAGSGLALGSVIAGAAFHGLGFGSMTTASFTVVDEVLPPSRRGEGVGYWSASQPIVQGLGATASFAIMAAVGFTVLFLGISVVAVLAAALFAALRLRPRDTDDLPRRTLPSSFRIGRSVLVPILACASLSFVGGALILTIPLLGLQMGVTNPGIFYLASAVLGVLARLTTGRLSDRRGRIQVAVPGFLLLAAVITGLVLAADLGALAFIVAGAVHGVAAAAALPAMQALVLDRSPVERRGMSAAAMGMAFDVGFGSGSVLVGAITSAAGPATALLATAVAPLVSVGLLGIDSVTTGRRAAR